MIRIPQSQCTLSRRRLLTAAAGGSVALVTGLPSGVAWAATASAVATGIDYSWGRPSPSVTAGSGYSFVCRYLSYSTTGKSLSASEAQALIAAGLDIVLVWEDSPDDALNGFALGAQHATDAQAMALSCGMPAERPIYFAVDFDATAAQQSAINDYFDGAASVIGYGRTGAYGGYYPVQRLFDAGKISWGWQTYAWSGGQWDSRAQLRQVQNGITVDGADCDADEAWAADFGQWGNGSIGGGGGGVITAGSELAVGANADGRLEMFAIRGGGLVSAWQTAASGSSFSAMTSLGGAQLSANVVTANNQDGRVQVFAIGGDGHVYSEWQTPVNGTFSDWYDLDGPVSHGIAVGSNADGRLQVFAVDGDGAVQTAWQTSVNGPFSSWISLGGSRLSGVLATGNNADGRLQLFALGGDGLVYSLWQTSVNGSFSGWYSLNSPALLGLSVGTNPDGRLQAFGTDLSGALQTAFQGSVNGSFNSWKNLGGTRLSARTAVGNNADGRLQVFVLGGDGAVYTMCQTSPNGPMSSWVNLGATQLRSLAVDVNTDGRMQLFAIGGDGVAYTTWQNYANGTWGNYWPSLG